MWESRPVSTERPPETIGQRLRRLRRDRSLSQRELAEPGVSYAYISRIEAGTRQPSVKALRKLSRKLGVSTEYLETGSDVREEELRELRLARAELDLRLGHDPEWARERVRSLLAEAEEAGDPVAARAARLALGVAAVETGRTEEATALLEEAVEADDVSPALRPDVFRALGRAYAETGRPHEAVALFERSLAELERELPAGHPARVRFAAYLASAHAEAGQPERCAEVLGAIAADAGAVGEPGSEARGHWSLGRAAEEGGRVRDALDHLRRALALREAADDAAHVAHALGRVTTARVDGAA
jgi:transcriptional regulator with XRE-family HTH domain